MTPARLLADLRARGVTFERHGNRVRYAPASLVTAGEVDMLRAHKAELLELLDNFDLTSDAAKQRARDLTPGERARLRADAQEGNALAAATLRTIATMADGEVAAWRLYSSRLDVELWLVRDLEALAALQADGAVGELPVVLADELPALRGRDDEDLRRLLTAKQVFGPTTRLNDLGDDE